MSNLSINIDLDNAAFDGPELNKEVARLMRDFADHVEHVDREDLEGHPFVARDINGNNVGYFDFFIDEPELDEEEESQPEEEEEE